MFFKIKLIALTLFLSCNLSAQTETIKNDSLKKNPEVISSEKIQKPETIEKVKKWFENIAIRGYAQVRYNRLLETNPDLGCEQCDRSWGNNGGLFIRRGRLIFSGNVHERIFIYIQPDFASSAGTTNNILQLRDAYFDIALDTDKEYRFRIGQSKVPYGFENMQSSQNRLTLDRNDALNSAVSNERDLGVFFYWAPKSKRDLFKKLVDENLKGSGDYGVVGLGVYNGQTANRSEANNDQHLVARVSYPFEFKNGQVLETGVQAYKGKYVVGTKTAGVTTLLGSEYKDERIAASITLYPKPFGFQAEYNIGKGPQYNKTNNTIEEKSLKGGYVQIFYSLKIDKQQFFPFIKYQSYQGGKKHELDARSYDVKDLEIGIEWQPFKNFELVADYTISNRRYEDAVLTDNHQKGSLLRLQAQVNF
ncbi:porin [Flavobacterium sp. H122]|uniref:porin n=1 Tax=Flavobacterium sp. H122 TaxID=2529860 RepID=UPI0010AA4FF3|nr:porin [Flavobacterium sp. H122]